MSLEGKNKKCEGEEKRKEGKEEKRKKKKKRKRDYLDPGKRGLSHFREDFLQI